MKFLNKPNDNFFYFFAAYSFLFLLFQFIDALAILQVLTYIWFLIFFCYRLYSYFHFVSEHKVRIAKIKNTKWQKELSSLVREAEENFKEWGIILLLTVCFFIASLFLWTSSSQKDISETTYAWKAFIESQKLKTQLDSLKKQKLTDNEFIEQEKQIQEPEELSIKDESEEVEKRWESWNLNKQSQELINVLQVEDEIEKKQTNQESWTIPIKPKEIPGNLIKTDSQDSLSVEKNFTSQVKDIYFLQPFTKDGSDFSNVLQLQRVLSQLWYYSWVADWVFNFETKLAIYNTLVGRCNWPKDTTKWVFGPQAKQCIDNLYITVEDWEGNWLWQ